MQDCSVIGVPDEKWGEAVMAIVQPKSGVDIDSVELVDLVKSKLRSLKAPKSIDLLAELPRSSNGKVLKAEPRKRYWDGQDRNIG